MTIIKQIGIFLLITLAYTVLWISGITLGITIFGAEAPGSSASDGAVLGLMFAASALNTAVIMFAVANSRWRGGALTATLVAEIFGVQFFMSQIETLIFNRALGLSLEFIFAIVFGGLIIALGVAPLTVWLMGKMRGPAEPATFERRGTPDYVWRVALLAIVIYPALYLLAGHFIAWQFADVRELYTGSTANRSFMASLRPFLTDGLWFTQIVRGLLWIGLGLPVVWMTRDGFPRSGLVLGLLFAVLMNAQHLLPNAFMPDTVRLAHGIETASSNFVWGVAIAWLLTPRPASLRVSPSSVALQGIEIKEV